ncbi:hypothetical protein [Kitasatospora sp. SUK 42]|uniref:hypothetical protein n=1 Tax=Kitasatospora sp. SUK 42 TaxID=1588882 RepID=UPI0018CA45AE|nr:hypothetical protein [Kitasatospora sp. SUK 42]MBV2155827.1 hypothetical protein [Kitasatospora sp. SUK 42]
MSSADLMGGYAAYTTPNAAIQELATTGVADVSAEVEVTPTVTLVILSLVTIAVIG